MDLFETLWTAFSLEHKPIHDLIKISSFVDSEKSSANSMIFNPDDDLSNIASIIIALLKNQNTFSLGQQLYDALNNLIVEKNRLHIDSIDNEKILKRINDKKYSGTYKIRNTTTGYKFDLVSTSGEVLATSQIYTSLDSCAKGIETTQKYINSTIEDQTLATFQSINNPKYEIYQDKAGMFRFRLKAANGQVIIVSEGYCNNSSCYDAINNIKHIANSNDVELN